MKYIYAVLLTAVVSSCAHLPFGDRPEARQRTALWEEAHNAVYAENFSRADTVFRELVNRFPHATEGREALFYLGTIRLDPRNPDWSSQASEQALQAYLAQDSVRPVIHRRPEGTTLYELARQLNMPPADRMAALQPGTQVIREPVVVAGERNRELAAEVETLRRQAAERDAEIRRLNQELQRIRRTLAPRTP